MDRLREQQRSELHKTIWRIANDLRGSVDGWDFKSYVLGILFYRFISENLTAYLDQLEREAGDVDYTRLPDSDAEFGRKDTVDEKGFYILPSELFTNVQAQAAGDENLNGTAAIVEYPGVLYRGGAEQKIRKYLIDNNYVDAVIQLPPDLFFGTTIATCIIVLKKSKRDNAVLFVNASAEFVRQGNKNKLGPASQTKILNTFAARADLDHFARLVSNDDVAENSYNISVTAYVEAEDTTEMVDITALNAEISRIVARQTELRVDIDAIVADLEAGR